MAKQLVKKHGYKQREAARKIGITQAAISHYLAEKRGARGIKDLRINFPLVESMACEAAEKIANNEMNPDEIITYFCKLCTTMRESNYYI